MTREMRFTLNEEDFRKLVRGEIIKKDVSGGPVAFFLQDLGYSLIQEIIDEAYSEFVQQKKDGLK